MVKLQHYVEKDLKDLINKKIFNLYIVIYYIIIFIKFLILMFNIKLLRCIYSW